MSVAFDSLQGTASDQVEMLRSVIDCMPSGVVVVDEEGGLVIHNAAARNTLASRFMPLERCWGQREVFDVDGQRRLAPRETPLHRALQGEICDGVEVLVKTPANREAVLRMNSRPMLQVDRGRLWAVGVFQDISEEIAAGRHQRELERQLQQAQKMESLGQLASGIAHEINTPTQYIADNVRFLGDAFEGLLSSVDAVVAAMEAGRIGPEVVGELRDRFEDAEVSFFREEVPLALEQSLEGLDRVASIVRAMKEFTHPSTSKEPTDLDHVVKTTVAMAKNEYKYVADLALELDGDLPRVACVAGEISQVLLNLVVNAAHAIEEAARERGLITIRTRGLDDGVEIDVEDNGAGIPGHVVDRVFDPFFTTKPVGKGTGQGLALAFDVLVRKHGGRLDVRSTPGVGTVFTVFVPRSAREAPKP